MTRLSSPSEVVNCLLHLGTCMKLTTSTLLIVSSAKLLNQFTCNPQKTKKRNIHTHTFCYIHPAEEQETAYIYTNHVEHSQQFLYITLKTLN